MSLVPASTNDRYRGSVAAAWFLAALGVLTIVPGAIHVFLPDGGAGVIAGIDLGACGPTVIALFAWAGATQMAFGAMMLLIAVRHRPLVPATLALVLLERSLHALDGWLLKTGSGHHPPEHYAALIGAPLLAVALAASLRTRTA
jgi:hypothetical protein